MNSGSRDLLAAAAAALQGDDIDVEDDLHLRAAIERRLQRGAILDDRVRARLTVAAHALGESDHLRELIGADIKAFMDAGAAEKPAPPMSMRAVDALMPRILADASATMSRPAASLDALQRKADDIADFLKAREILGDEQPTPGSDIPEELIVAKFKTPVGEKIKFFMSEAAAEDWRQELVLTHWHRDICDHVKTPFDMKAAADAFFTMDFPWANGMSFTLSKELVHHDYKSKLPFGWIVTDNSDALVLGGEDDPFGLPENTMLFYEAAEAMHNHILATDLHARGWRLSPVTADKADAYEWVETLPEPRADHEAPAP